MTTVESDYYAFMHFDPVETKKSRSHFVQHFDTGPVLELACGRGEFLALLAEAGIEASGVDLDPGMVQTAVAAGHDVVVGDALEALATRPDGSLRGLFCAHFLEHLPSEQVEQVYRDAARVLEPDGTFVAVVPNMGSLSVLSYDFWRDPTHVRPYDPMVLGFFADRAGLDVIDSGANPLVDPGPPPQLWPIESDPVHPLGDQLAALAALIEAQHRRRFLERIRHRLSRAPQHSIDPWQQIVHMVGKLDDSVQSLQHHLYDLRSAYVNALEQLYPPNEVFVVARKGRSLRPHG